MTCRLNKHGYIIVTLLDNYTVIKKLRESNTNAVKSDHFEIVFQNKTFDRSQPFGHKYLFYLADSVGTKEKD